MIRRSDEKEKTVKKGIIVHPDEFGKRHIDRAAELGIDVIGIHPEGGKRAAESLSELVELCKTAEFRGLVDYAYERGLKIEYEAHTASYLVERSLFEEHPEYFREDENGERIPDANFCISNKEALDIAAKNAVALAHALYRTPHDFYFWLDDVNGKKCNCEKCRKLTASDQQLIFSNRIAKELKKHFYDTRVPYIAYRSTLEPPLSVKPESGVFLEYAPMEKYVKQFPDRIEAERISFDPIVEFFGANNTKILEYWLDNSLFSGWRKPPKPLPALDPESIAADIAFYASRGIEDITTFACFLGDDYEKLYGEPDIAAYAKAFELAKKYKS